MKTIYQERKELNRSEDYQEEHSRILYLEEAMVTLMLTEANKIMDIACNISETAQNNITKLEEEGNMVLISFSLLLIVIIGISTLRIAKGISIPLNHLTKSADTIRKGDLDTIVPDLGLDEFGELSRSLDSMRLSRQSAEKELKEFAQRLSIHVEQTPLGVIEWDLNFKVAQWNKAAENIFGYLKKEAIGQNGFELVVPKEVHHLFQSVWEDLVSGKGGTQSINENITKDGKTIICEWYNTTLLDSNGVAFGVASLVQDITKRKRAEEERKKLQNQLIQAQKMQSIGTLAGGIAHDFNNILYPIIGFAEMLKEDLPLDSPEYESAQEIYNAGRRGGELVKQILAFSRQTEHKLSPVRFQKILTEVYKLTRSSIPSDIEIHLDIQKDCGLVMAESTQMHQVAMNLITNAYHAVEKASGKISIQLKEIILDNDDIKDSPLQSGQYVMLSVSDNGVGIPREITNNIFEPYFTTKEKGKGTGLGLAVVHGIVKEHKGDIKVYSEEGKGTTFNVYLPLMNKSTEPISTEKELNKLTGTERILLVDDEESIVRLEKQTLERLGYNVSVRSDSLEALETFNSNPDNYDLVITDMTMPKMTGDKLAKELMSIRSDIPIIICTGFSERVSKEQAEANKVKGFLMKPLVKSEMAQMVRKVLDDAKVYKGN